MRDSPNGLMVHTALFSDCGRYRYTLERQWDPDTPAICWIMLNPSKANAEQNDPTIRRCIDFAWRWKAGGIIVVNLFALVATFPAELAKAEDAVGPVNDEAIRQAVMGRRVICAWGNVPRCPWLDSRALAVAEILESTRTPLKCLGLTKAGQPSHPLYLSAAVKPRRFLRRKP